MNTVADGNRVSGSRSVGLVVLGRPRQKPRMAGACGWMTDNEQITSRTERNVHARNGTPEMFAYSLSAVFYVWSRTLNNVPIELADRRATNTPATSVFRRSNTIVLSLHVPGPCSKQTRGLGNQRDRRLGLYYPSDKNSVLWNQSPPIRVKSAPIATKKKKTRQFVALDAPRMLFRTFRRRNPVANPPDSRR